MIISQIVAMAKNRVIGKDNQMPWHLPEDLKRFRKITSNSIVIMGRKTFESIGKPLPKRLNVIITRNPEYKAQGCEVFTSVAEALEFCNGQKDKWGEEVFIIGGAEIYRQTISRTDRIYLTLIDKEFEGDTFFPEYGHLRETQRENIEGDPAYSYLLLEK
jgi:dihydrofolate reductase